MRKTRPAKPVPASEKPAPGRLRVAVRSPRGGRPTKDEAEQLSSRILTAAAELFERQGFAATSMEQVAAACGVGKDTLYRRYPSKADLFTALMNKLQAVLMPELERILGLEADPLEKLRHYARSLLSINLRPELLALNRVALGEAMPFGGVKPVPQRQDPIMDRFAALVANAQRAGSLDVGDANFIAEQLLYATSIKPMIAAMLGEKLYFETDRQDTYFEQAWAQFLAGAAPRQTSPSSTPDRGRI